MYVVRDKKSKCVIHVNPAPLSQGLKEYEVYHLFNPDTMEIGHKEGLLPEYFDINEQGEIVAFTMLDLVSKGIVELKPYQKVVDNRIVEKSVSELIEEELLQLAQDRNDEMLVTCRRLEDEINSLKKEYQSLKKRIASVKREVE